MPAPRHRSRPVRLAALGSVLAVAAALLAGCGSTAEAGARNATYSTQPSDTFPVTVTHQFGETTVTAEPQRVVVVGLTEQDVLLVIGTSSAVIPIGRIAHESRALTLLSNLTAEPELVRTNGEPNFDVALYGPTEEKAEAIEQKIARWLS